MSLTVNVGDRRRTPVADLAAASAACRAYIDEHGLGSSEWNGGAVYDGRKLVARVSYNGRVWEPGTYPTAEILL